MEKKPQFSGPRRPAGGSRPRPGQRGRGGDRRNDPYATNEHIRAREVRLVGDNVEQGVYPIAQALKIAERQQLDLVEISPTAEPPVCRVIDYQKFLYQQKKRQKEQKQKAAKVVVKEIRFGPQTDDHDYNFKLKHAQGFLREGSKVKAYVSFRAGKVEMMPVLEGKRMSIMIAPLKVAPKKEKPADKPRGDEKAAAPAGEDAEKKEVSEES